MKRTFAFFIIIAILLSIVGCTGVQNAETYGDTGGDTEDESGINSATESDTDAFYESDTDAVTEPEDDEKVKTIKVLAIGNSFSVDAMQHLWGIFADGGYEKIILGNLYIGGCTLNTHWSNIQNNSTAYIYYKTTNGVWLQNSATRLSTALADEDWDYITVQQASGGSGQASTYSNLQKILGYLDLNKTNPDAKILWHMTWAYEGDSTHADFSKYNNNQMTMYESIVSAVRSEVTTKPLIEGVIPSGTAIQNLRTTYVGDNVTRDGYHLDNGFGRYAAALTWYGFITGQPVEDIDWVPKNYPNVANYLDAIKESVGNALSSPYEVTRSQLNVVQPTNNDAALFTASGLDISSYTPVELGMSTGTFYNSTKSFGLRTSADGESASLLSKFSGSSVFTKTQLPEGTVIIVDSGYRYRPDGWKDGSTLTGSSARPANVSQNFTVIDNDWWGDLTLRGFNLSKTDDSAMTDGDNTHLRIYVPKK